MLIAGVGIFPTIRIYFTLFYGIAEGALGHRSMLKLYELKNAVQGLVFRRLAVTWPWSFLSSEGFHFSTMRPGLGSRVCFIEHVFKFLNRGLSTNL